MNREDFTKSAPGTCVEVNTNEGPSWAFIPDPLPPHVDYGHELISLLQDARGVLGELSREGLRMDNPYLLIRPYLRREALASCRIEGTQSTLSELYLSEVSEGKPLGPDVQEVINYVRAMEFSLEPRIGLPLITTWLVRSIHEVLMLGVDRASKEPGQLRQSQVYIGSKSLGLSGARYVPPPETHVSECLTAWESYLNAEAKEPNLVRCALMHYQFEAIHPFDDGNGRVGRLLITYFLVRKGILSQPLLYLSEFFERDRDGYNSRLLAVSQKGDWQGWLEFFMRGVIAQAGDALSVASDMLELRKDYKERLEKTSYIPQLAHRLVEEVFFNPYTSIRDISRKWGRLYNTVKTGVERLEKIGILRPSRLGGRKKLYVAWELMDLLTKQPAATRESQVQRTLGFD